MIIKMKGRVREWKRNKKKCKVHQFIEVGCVLSNFSSVSYGSDSKSGERKSFVDFIFASST